MIDWIDILGDCIFKSAEQLMDSSRPIQIVGVFLVSLLVFVVVGTLGVLLLGF